MKLNQSKAGPRLKVNLFYCKINFRTLEYNVETNVNLPLINVNCDSVTKNVKYVIRIRLLEQLLL
jgi:hypothetical protein